MPDFPLDHDLQEWFIRVQRDYFKIKGEGLLRGPWLQPFQDQNRTFLLVQEAIFEEDRMKHQWACFIDGLLADGHHPHVLQLNGNKYYTENRDRHAIRAIFVGYAFDGQAICYKLITRKGIQSNRYYTIWGGKLVTLNYEQFSLLCRRKGLK